MYLSLYCKGSKRVTQGFTVRGSWRPNRTAVYWPPLVWSSALCLSRSADAQPVARGLRFLLSAGYIYYILSATSLDPTSIGDSKGPFGLAWLSLPHLHSNSNSDFLSWLGYILVQRPLNCPLNPWNGMFDRHQVGLTVMEFTSHFLPVHQSMSVPWDFFPCPILLARSTDAIFPHKCHRNVSLPSGASLWNGKFGRVEGQNTTSLYSPYIITFRLFSK